MDVILKTKPKPLPKLVFTKDETTKRILVTEERYCGVCLFDRVEVIRLNTEGHCPTCGADYGKDTR